MSIRCFVSSLVDLTPIGGLDKFISAVIDQRFSIRDGKLVARGYADHHRQAYASLFGRSLYVGYCLRSHP